MPATYAPGPRSNAADYTRHFWACQGLNTTSSGSVVPKALYVGGLRVDNPATELGTGWVTSGYKLAKPTYLSWSTRVREKASVEISWAGCPATSWTWMLCAEARILTDTCLPSA